MITSLAASELMSVRIKLAFRDCNSNDKETNTHIFLGFTPTSDLKVDIFEKSLDF